MSGVKKPSLKQRPLDEQSPVRRLALLALANAPRTKSELALAVHGRDDGSTRAMTTRNTAALTADGLISERREGTRRIVQLTARGRTVVDAWRAAPADITGLSDGLRHAVDEAMLAKQDPFPEDRPRFHLRHAAMLALAHHLRGATRAPGDDHYVAVLRALIDLKNTPTSDGKLFAQIEPSWPDGDHRRKLLCESLIMFQQVDARRDSGRDLMLLAEQLEPGPHAVLWATGAIELAHVFTFAAASPLERVMARKLLHHATELMARTVSIPGLEVAAQHRLVKAAKVGGSDWVWSAPVRHPAAAPAADDALTRELEEVDTVVDKGGQFNQVLERFDRALFLRVGRWIVRDMPTTEWVFRRAGGLDIGKQIEHWALAEKERGTIRALLVDRVKQDQEAARELRAFRDQARTRIAPEFALVAEPYIAQATALLDEPVTAPVPKGGYAAMLLNNQWTPEMVAADVVAATC